MRKAFVFITAVVMISISACTSKPGAREVNDYVKWIASTESGLVREKEIGGIRIKSRYLPAEYLAYREHQASDSVSYDSLVKSYRCGLTFQVTLQADRNDKQFGNLLQYKAFTHEELMARIRYLSFGMDNFISAEHNGTNYSPVLSQYEGFDAISNRISFQVVFVIPEYECGRNNEKFGDVIIMFDDPFWEIGKNKFLFTRENFRNTPGLIF